MTVSITVHDPFLNKDVQVSHKLTDRLRGRYASGPTMPNGEPEFGWREFQTPPVQHEAAAKIERLEAALSQCEEYFDNRADVKDGDYGAPEPNTEMRLLTEVREALGTRI